MADGPAPRLDRSLITACKAAVWKAKAADSAARDALEVAKAALMAAQANEEPAAIAAHFEEPAAVAAHFEEPAAKARPEVVSTKVRTLNISTPPTMLKRCV